MKNKFDIVVVGAGPVGSYLSCLLAQNGFEVGLIEKKKKIGEGAICAGVIGKKAFDRYELPVDSIVSKIDSVSFFSPSGQRLEYTPEEVFAYIVDRDALDRRLFLKARKAGVETHLNQRVNDISGVSQFYSVRCGSTTYRAKAVVIATGIDYRLHAKVGFGRPRGFLYGSQIELPVSRAQSRIEVHIGCDFAPGSFGWLVPYRAHKARIGVLLSQRGKKWLMKLIAQRLGSADPVDVSKIQQKPIAYGPIDNSVQGGILAVGEAAGQVKTTTGGGIHYGLLCAEIAADRLRRTLKQGYSLHNYDVTWRSALAAELDIGMNLRSIAGKLKDHDLDNLFTFVKQNRFWVELLVPRIDFDFHSDVIYFCMKSFGQLLGLKEGR
ncbi:MAG: NAD(P)/FAD-dependent oxidoreductase [candidate division WOR-3 bacterium]|nr:MAG: NAD(P)/FAD-dependent oxidoreductase [candidate division WOR-3 bacterium]